MAVGKKKTKEVKTPITRWLVRKDGLRFPWHPVLAKRQDFTEVNDPVEAPEEETALKKLVNAEGE